MHVHSTPNTLTWGSWFRHSTSGYESFPPVPPSPNFLLGNNKTSKVSHFQDDSGTAGIARRRQGCLCPLQSPPSPWPLGRDPLVYPTKGFPGGTSSEGHTCQCRRDKSSWFDPWFRKIPWRRACNPLQYSCLENSTDRGTRKAIVHRVAKSWT